MTESFLDGRVTLHPGDCLEVLARLEANSIDSVVTDPPYHLTSIVQRFGADNAAPAKSNGATGVYARASSGFMGKKWDGGDVAFRTETWKQILRVLKPGGHLLAFGGTRTYHRMACAIEDAGFEIRDCVQWLYGSGFPKSLDVSKAIDKRPGVSCHAEFAIDLRAAMAAKGYTNTFDVAERVVGKRTGAVANWQKYQWPEAKWWPVLRDLLGMDAKWNGVIAEAERERIAFSAHKSGIANGAAGHHTVGGTRAEHFDITAPSTDAARQWSGFGTALKPACEPIVLARKPLIGTVAENVLKHGTGALNIDGCRVATDGETFHAPQSNPENRTGVVGIAMQATGDAARNHAAQRASIERTATLGRWPANVIHDGSDEVVEAFPDAAGQIAPVGPKNGAKPSVNTYGDYGPREQFNPRGDSGSAARFFYTAKADSDDRLGSKHPTVKPLDLMQWLVRLVTPPGGCCLDPFAGTGTTGEAAWREGMRAVLIEREPEYQNDIRRRMALCLSGPDERKREAIKARMKDRPVDAGPLFAGSETPPAPADRFTESSRTNNRADGTEVVTP